MLNINQLKTGDILLFNESPRNIFMSGFTSLIKHFTYSNYSHIALVIVDPPFASHLKGVFIWESSYHGTKDPSDNRVKFGVQLTPLSIYTQRYPGQLKIYKRSPINDDIRNLFTQRVLHMIHNNTYLKKYDVSIFKSMFVYLIKHPNYLLDWHSAYLKYNIEHKMETFTCSAFVSYVLTQVGILDANTSWTKISAADLSYQSKTTMIQWNHHYKKEEPICIK